jgi:CRISPR-associated protein Cmr1
MDILFRTLTPIWTGGVTRDSSTVHETGIIGSLRWWYEGIIRGMGGYACDPTQHTCLLDAEKYEKGVRAGHSGARLLAEAGLCPACQLFGATGWQRQFRLQVNGLNPEPVAFAASPDMHRFTEFWLSSIFDARDKEDRQSAGGGKKATEITVKALWGDEASLSFIPLGDDRAGVEARVANILYTIHLYGGLGAKTQNGFGMVRLGTKLEPDVIYQARRLIRSDIQAHRKAHPHAPPQGQLFSTSRFFSITYTLKGDAAQKYVENLKEFGDASGKHHLRYRPCAFDLRYKYVMGDKQGNGAKGMRPTLKATFGKRAAGELLGNSKAKKDDERSGSRIHVSHLYRTKDEGDWQLRVWGFVPEGLKDETGKALTVDVAKAAVNDFLVGATGLFPGSAVTVEFDAAKGYR